MRKAVKDTYSPPTPPPMITIAIEKETNEDVEINIRKPNAHVINANRIVL